MNSTAASGACLSELKFSRSFSSQDLDFSGKGMKEFPKEVLGMTDVKTLDLSDNKLTNIPSEIQNLKYLTVLKLNGNKIYELPSVVSKLKFLKEIYLDREIWQYRLNEVKKITAARIILVG
ncbi:MAG: leucine-rich repeat domain-containing protein [Bacteroidetes bacterium]|nr:leucine-rich repeat domain-containing protein [Bacteroidota bacterium]